jgi:hypothetical protein
MMVVPVLMAVMVVATTAGIMVVVLGGCYSAGNIAVHACLLRRRASASVAPSH